jgi:hypothetical protein
MYSQKLFNWFQKGENDGERRSRVTSVYSRQSKVNEDLSESDHEEKRIAPVSLPDIIH